MSSGYPLFDQILSGPPEPTGPPLTGEDLRDSGIDSALARAERVKGKYVEDCLKAIASFPRGTLLTSEDVREKAGEPPQDVDKSVMAGILRKAQKSNLIVVTDQTRMAKRVSVHAKKLSLWRRL